MAATVSLLYSGSNQWALPLPPIGLPLTEAEKLILRILAWKTRHPGVTAAAVDDLRVSVLPDLPSWYKIRTAAARLAPDITADEYPCCVNTCYARTDESPRLVCPHCKEALFIDGNEDRPRKIYPVFKIGPRLVRQWSRSDRAQLLRDRYTSGEDWNGPARDHTDSRVYRRIRDAYETDQYTHFLGISMDGFQVFKQ